MSKKFWFPLMLLALSVVTVSCQSVGLNQIESAETAEYPNNLAVESFGSGNAKILMLLGSDSRSVGFRNGAVLAMTDLGEAALTLQIVPANKVDGALSRTIEKEVRNGTINLVASSETVAAVDGALQRSKVPVVSLSRSAPAGQYAFLPSAMTSLVAGVDFALLSGDRRLVAVVPDQQSQAFHDALKQLSSEEEFGLFEIATRSGQRGRDVIKQNLKVLKSADAVIFADVGPHAAASAAEFLSTGSLKSEMFIISSDLASYGTDKLNGAVMARADTSATSLISSRYQTTFGVPFTQDAAYGYDVIAMATQLARANGKKGMTREKLETPSGFKGTTGSFRFLSDGRTERLYDIVRIQSGQPRIIKRAEPRF
ncbi:ABC transporter substrate-binding protein [Cohaesibacter haloalkalitolerans]|uniref:ABC transporter substrate-binding protein n=1 Tax=Cohaesibacter haloalkalitolerans TaxID=1162980 RepID=UPI0013C4F243|nr:ABC transporter substrate-binding protein [Cohaesibacter haloalkalitolerans]